MGVAYPSAIFAAPDGSGYTYSITAKISWDNSYYVTVESVWSDELSESQFSWRIKGRASQGDTNTYAEEYVNDSFQGAANKEYVLQGCCVPGGVFDNSGSNYLFKLTSDSSGDDDDSGGDSGGGDPDSGTPCGVIHISKGEGVKTLNVTRRPVNTTNYIEVYDGDTIYTDDNFNVSFETESGYELDFYPMDDGFGGTVDVPIYSTNLVIVSYRGGNNLDAYMKSASDVTIRATTNGNSGGSGGDSGNDDTNNDDYSGSGSIPLSPSSKAWDGEVVWEISNGKLYLSLYMWKTDGTGKPSSGGYTNSGYVRLNGSEIISFTYDQIEYDRTQYGETYITSFDPNKTYSISALVGGLSGTGYAGTTLSGSGEIGSSSGGGDSGGGSGSSGSNSGLKEYTFTALGVKAKATYTSGPEVTITILSWSGYSSIPYWRIKGVYSEGDSNTYLEQNNNSSNSFDAYGGYDDGGKNYIFQVCKNGSWNNDGGDASKFHVDFSLAGEGGGEVVDSYTIYFNEGEGTNLTVTRTSSAYGATGTMYANGDIYYDDIWANDRFEIVVEAQEGYQLNELIVDGLQYADGVYTFSGSGNASITTSATLVASARIFNKNTSSWNMYAPYIYDGSNWNRYRPYIYDGSNWNTYN